MPEEATLREEFVEKPIEQNNLVKIYGVLLFDNFKSEASPNLFNNDFGEAFSQRSHIEKFWNYQLPPREAVQLGEFVGYCSRPNLCIQIFLRLLH